MVEITCGLKAPHRLSADCADFKRRSLDYTVKRKLMAAGSGMVLKGFAFGMALGGLTSGPPAFADQPSSWQNSPPLTVPRRSAARVITPRRPCGSCRARSRRRCARLASRASTAISNWSGRCAATAQTGKRTSSGNTGTSSAETTRKRLWKSARSHLRLPWHRLCDGDRPDDWPHANWGSSHRHHQPKRTGADFVPHHDSDARPLGVAEGQHAPQPARRDDAHNGGFGQGGPEVDFYDLSVDCLYPQLLASQAVGTGTDGGPPSPAIPKATKGRGRRTALPTISATT